MDPQGPATLAGLEEATLVLLPQAAGSLLPEFMVVLRSPARAGQVEEILSLVPSLLGLGEAALIKTLGKGDDAIRYVPLKKMFAAKSSVGISSQIMMSMLGGGFVSAKRVGDKLYLGFNPRTMRKLVRAVKKGQTLAKRPGFLTQLPKSSGRALEAWFDFKAIARSLRMMDSLPLLFLGMRSNAQLAAVAEARASGQPLGGGVRKPQQAGPKLRFPSAEDLAAVLGEEFLWSERDAHGWTIHSRGGTMLSPPAWAATIMAGNAWTSLLAMFRQ